METLDISSIINEEDNGISTKMAFNGEHQSTPVDEPKLRQMGNYEIQQIHDHNIPHISAVLTNIPEEKHLHEFAITRTMIIRPQYIVYDEKNIEKRLNRAKEIINNNEHLSNVDALNLGFAPRDKALEITEEVIKLYGRASEQLSIGMKVTLYNVIYQMIDAYSKLEEDYQRLIDMLDNSTDEETGNELKFVKKLKKENEILKKRVDLLENELNLRNRGPLNGK